MAALSLGHFLHISVEGSKPRCYPRCFSHLSCQRDDQVNNSSPKVKKETKQEKVGEIWSNAEKFVKGIKDSLSPKQKGDWKDVVLMSLSFAVYVYISQQIVCAYCAWTSMLKQPW